MNAESVGKGKDVGIVSILFIVVLTNHVWADFGSMRVITLCVEQKRWSALPEVKSLNRSALVWQQFDKRQKKQNTDANNQKNA